MAFDDEMTRTRSTFFTRHRHRQHHRRITVSVSLRVGQTTTLTATADDPTGTADPNAVDTWASDDAGAFGTLTGSGATATFLGVAPGVANVVASATDPDGKVTASDPFAVTVTAAFAATDAATVTVTASPPA
jgi:hypothetical protein